MMKKILKFILVLLAVAVVAIAGLLIYVKTALPNVADAPDLTIEVTPERLERGEYLAHHVMGCIDCHSTRDWRRFAGPIIAGTEGKGGEIFDQNMGFPGRYVSANITPYGIKDQTDGELFRVITTGVNSEGDALFPIMPYHNFGKLDKSDIESVIAYIRTLDPIEHDVESSVSDFPINFIINTIPKEAQFSVLPDKNDLIKYGEYMTTAASCNDCHTNQVGGKIVGEPYAGGMEFKFPDGSLVRSANITPHATGIGNWTEEQFLNKFRIYSDSSYVAKEVSPGEYQTLMPWEPYSGMTDEDLLAIFHYLQSVKAVENVVTKFE